MWLPTRRMHNFQRACQNAYGSKANEQARQVSSPWATLKQIDRIMGRLVNFIESYSAPQSQSCTILGREYPAMLRATATSHSNHLLKEPINYMGRIY